MLKKKSELDVLVSKWLSNANGWIKFIFRITVSLQHIIARIEKIFKITRYKKIAVPNPSCVDYFFLFNVFHIDFLKRFYSFIFREGKGGRKRGRENDVWLRLAHPLLGTWPATQACAPTGNTTSDSFVPSAALSPLSHLSPDSTLIF